MIKQMVSVRLETVERVSRLTETSLGDLTEVVLGYPGIPTSVRRTGYQYLIPLSSIPKSSPVIPERVCGVSSILILAERVLVDNASIEVLKQPGCDERLYRIYVVKR
jgi:hypothetical protein